MNEIFTACNDKLNNNKIKELVEKFRLNPSLNSLRFTGIERLNLCPSECFAKYEDIPRSQEPEEGGQWSSSTLH